MSQTRPALVLYQQKLASGMLTPDPYQHSAITLLADVQCQLLAPQRWWRPVRHIQGLYLWGPVGRGKTMLMDMFCEGLPEGTALRLHFHRFMRYIHQQLMAASGKVDPLAFVADSIARQARVLCFDEFYVDNIGDAMLLGRLLKHLFSRGVTLITTSNQPPDGLYPDGLHRDRFLPAIALLQQQLRSVPLSGPEDHRMRHLTVQQAWFVQSESNFDAIKSQFSTSTITICGRIISCLIHQSSKSSIGFEFEALCSGYRSAADYIELAERFETLWLFNVPHFYAQPREQIKARGTEDGAIAQSTGERQVCWSARDDPARRFISLVDELYDRRINLRVYAQSTLEALYPADGALAFQFQRTLSRLTEMASLEYQQSTAHSALPFSHGGPQQKG